MVSINDNSFEIHFILYTQSKPNHTTQQTINDL